MEYHQQWRKTESGRASLRESQRIWAEKYPERLKAQKAVNYAIRRKRMERGPCEMAGDDCKGRIEAHHDDYTKPLEVRWLCKRHHRQADAARRRMITDLPLFAPPPPPIELPSAALRTVERTILESKGVLSAESVEDRLTYAVREVLAAKPNAIGQVFMRLSRAGKIEHAGWTVAQRDAARGRALRLWRVKL